jgi:hypothetical protein
MSKMRYYPLKSLKFKYRKPPEYGGILLPATEIEG